MYYERKSGGVKVQAMFLIAVWLQLSLLLAKMGKMSERHFLLRVATSWDTFRLFCPRPDLWGATGPAGASVGLSGPPTSASKSSIRRIVITEKAPTRAFSWLNAATTAFTFKTLLRHYAKRALTPLSLNVKLGPQRNYHKGQAAIGRHYANQPARPLWHLCWCPNFTSTYRGVYACLA